MRSDQSGPRKRIIFLWENFGPTHIDRCEAVARRFPNSAVFGVELFSASRTYDWNAADSGDFRKVTLFGAGEHPGVFGAFARMVRAAWSIGRGSYFLCHYESRDTLMFAWWLRLTGNRVFMMGDSKYDDYRRHLRREVLKRLFTLPYHGAIAASVRSRDYLRFLGLPQRAIMLGYDTLSIDRIRAHAAAPPAPDGVAHSERSFAAVARLVTKKNLAILLDAYALYRRNTDRPRSLDLCGSGPLEASLKAQAERLGIAEHVRFHGFVQTDEVSRILGRSLALILPSIEEQFGLVVIEAQAMGLPVILSDNCGARDELVRTGVNGFLVEPDNPAGLAAFMAMLSEEESLWRSMAAAARDTASLGDSARFAESVGGLTARSGTVAIEAVPAAN